MLREIILDADSRGRRYTVRRGTDVLGSALLSLDGNVWTVRVESGTGEVVYSCGFAGFGEANKVLGEKLLAW